MENLIMNADWQSGTKDGPEYFTKAGSTYDDFDINGYRTCSITRSRDTKMVSNDVYTLGIDVQGKSIINWGYYIRAIDADDIILVIHFYDDSDRLIETQKQSITKQVNYEFMSQLRSFTIPYGSKIARLSMEFIGRITACTYCAPTAYFSE